MIPLPITIGGKSGTIVYMDAAWQPVTPELATMAKVLFDDGSDAFFFTEGQDDVQKFDPSQLRDEKGRWAKGSSHLGRTYLHGTAQGFLESILREGITGTRAGKIHPKDHRNKVLALPGHVYMTTDLEEAKKYAQSAGYPEGKEDIEFLKNTEVVLDPVYMHGYPRVPEYQPSYESGTQIGGGLPAVVTIELPPSVVKRLRKDKRSDILSPDPYGEGNWKYSKKPLLSQVARSYKGTIKPEWIKSISYETRDMATGKDEWHTIDAKDYKKPGPTTPSYLPQPPGWEVSPEWQDFLDHRDKKVAAEGVTFYIPLLIPVQSVAKKDSAFDEAKHPRNPAGSASGGEFTSSGTAEAPASRPTLVKEAAAGIAAIEKLIPKALGVGSTPQSWEEMDTSTQIMVRARYINQAVGTEAQQARREGWDNLADEQKFTMVGYLGGLTDKTVMQPEPKQWVTGATSGDESDTDYQQTRVLAQKLTELRTDELRKERGLVKPTPEFTIEEGIGKYYVKSKDTGLVVDHAYDELQAYAAGQRWVADNTVSTANLIENVWSSWKHKSSEGLGLSLQLAVAREFDGVHRMSPDEVLEAEDQATEYGGIDTLQAYVRAQWETTQFVMAKAGEQKLDVYRAIMLPSEKVNATKHQYQSWLGGELPPPTNIKERDLPNPTVTFDFAGETFVEPRQRTNPPKSILDLPKENDYQSMMAYHAAHPYEPVDVAVKRRLDKWERDYTEKPPYPVKVLFKLPDIKLYRAGAQSTTGTLDVANDWGGVGDLPENPVRVVLRISAPSTSVLSLPVYGKNLKREHESVLMGTHDKWVWDAWRGKAPYFSTREPFTTQKADTEPLIIDLQAEDRGQPHWLSGVQSVAKKDAQFDEAEHPREPSGTAEGGQFTASGKSGEATSDPALAKQAAEGIAAVEKLLPVAVADANYGDRPSGETWDDLETNTKDETRSAWENEQYENGVEVDTTGLDNDIKEEIQRENQEILDKAEKDLFDGLKKTNPFPDTGETLPLTNPGGDIPVQFDLHKQLDPETFSYGDGDHDTDDDTVPLELDALRFVGGEELTEEEKRLVVEHWNTAYNDAYQKEVEQAFESDSYFERRGELESDEVQRQWHNMSDEDKYDYMQQRNISHRSKAVVGGEPDKWVTGVETGTHTDEDYARTHAIALKLTELRTDQLRDERGVTEGTIKPTFKIVEKEHEEIGGMDEPVMVKYFTAVEDDTGRVIASGHTRESVQNQADSWASTVSTDASRIEGAEIASAVWKQWKLSSSEGLSLSMQLAVAEEFGGLHRMSQSEIAIAQESAREIGGMNNLRAYVRAQWEVTQMVMAKAGEPKAEVYRGLMLDGDRVEATTQDILDRTGQPVAPPTHIRSEKGLDAVGKETEYAVFNYLGEVRRVEKDRVDPTDPAHMTDWPDWAAVDSAMKESVFRTWRDDSVLGEEDAAKKYSEMADPFKYRLMGTYLQQRRVPRRHILSPRPYESEEKAVARKVRELMLLKDGGTYIRLPNLQLRRAGAQSTTGTPSVANSWNGVGNLPTNPIRVVLRIEAPATSVLSLPVYGQNEQGEHESVVIGTKDKWMWDAWRGRAPEFKAITVVHKADAPLVIDLQAEDRGKPHWLSSVDWTTTQKFDEALHPRDAEGQFTNTEAQGKWVEDLGSSARIFAASHKGARLVGLASSHILKGEAIPEGELYSNTNVEGIAERHEAAAETLVNEIRNAKEHSTVLYRGLGADDPIESLDTLKVGDTVTLDRISSFTANREVAALYANRQTMSGETYELKTEGPVKSVPTDSMTDMAHEEHLTEGKFEVVGILEQAPSISEDNGTVVHVDQVAGSKRTFWVTHRRSITLRQVGVF